MSGPLAQLYEEHSSMVAVLNAMSALVREVRERGKRIDPKVFRAILYYLDVFPEREHHRKEEAILFPRIRQRTRDADAILERARAGARIGRTRHPRTRAGLRAVRRARGRRVRALCRRGRPLRDALPRAYAQGRTRRDALAQRVLTAQDWADIEAAFALHRDPLAGASPETEHDQLFRRIVMIVPAPYGLGCTARRMIRSLRKIRARTATYLDCSAAWTLVNR